jgi:phosphoribosylformylglycinamidine synthase
MKYTLTITITLREGILDPEARAIQHALANLGFVTGKLTTARLFSIDLDAASEEEARSIGAKMCERLLANPVIHTFRVEVG